LSSPKAHPFADFFLQLRPSPYVIKWPEIISTCIGIGAICEVFVGSSPQATQCLSAIEASGQFQVVRQKQLGIHGAGPGVEASAQRAEMRSEISAETEVTPLVQLRSEQRDTGFGSVLRQ
jgi:hypothetical protein